MKRDRLAFFSFSRHDGLSDILKKSETGTLIVVDLLNIIDSVRDALNGKPDQDGGVIEIPEPNRGR